MCDESIDDALVLSQKCAMPKPQMCFPSFIVTKKLGTASAPWMRELRTECAQIAEVDDEGRAWSKKNYPAGFTSYASMNRLHLSSPNFASLAQRIDREVARFVKYLELDLNGGRLKMSTCWVNCMPQLSHHSMHLHPLSVVSGTFYIDTPPHSSGLKFEDPRLSAFMTRPPVASQAKILSRPHFIVPAKAGHLVLFESWMRHEVPAQLGKKTRVSVSFNYEWV